MARPTGFGAKMATVPDAIPQLSVGNATPTTGDDDRLLAAASQQHINRREDELGEQYLLNKSTPRPACILNLTTMSRAKKDEAKLTKLLTETWKFKLLPIKTDIDKVPYIVEAIADSAFSAESMDADVIFLVFLYDSKCDELKKDALKNKLVNAFASQTNCYVTRPKIFLFQQYEYFDESVTVTDGKGKMTQELRKTTKPFEEVIHPSHSDCIRVHGFGNEFISQFVARACSGPSDELTDLVTLVQADMRDKGQDRMPFYTSTLLRELRLLADSQGSNVQPSVWNAGYHSLENWSEFQTTNVDVAAYCERVKRLSSEKEPVAKVFNELDMLLAQLKEFVTDDAHAQNPLKNEAEIYISMADGFTDHKATNPKIKPIEAWCAGARAVVTRFSQN